MKISELKKQFEIRLEEAHKAYDIANTERKKVQTEYDKIWSIVCGKHDKIQADVERLGKILTNINKLQEMQKQEL